MKRNEGTSSTDRLAIHFGRLVRRTRRALRKTQAEIGAAIGLSQAAMSLIERGLLTGVSLRVIGDLCDVLEIQAEWQLRPPWITGASTDDGAARIRPGGRQHDAGHARSNAYVRRRLERLGWIVAQEIEITMGRTHGFIDILAFDPATRTLVLGEIKTELHDIGEVQRTMAWYEREARPAARRLGWMPSRIRSCVFLLVTRANDERVAANREALAQAYPVRSRVLASLLKDPSRWIPASPALVMIDPTGRKRGWLQATCVDGRRTPAPYADYRDFVERLLTMGRMSGAHAKARNHAQPPTTRTSER
ncbi:MAG: hypothetical protein XU10_C0016G0049 [Chloroflexi bacterium CSP1-4]|nr:MAG: hypothetical protein XU10_C0016G0049 [Chloroflexi bacterium CSP1-4]